MIDRSQGSHRTRSGEATRSGNGFGGSVNRADISADGVPLITTPLPGPMAQAWLERDERVVSASLARPYPLVVSHGSGCILTDVDGNQFLDFAAGIASCATGHAHPRVVEAIQEQSKRLLHVSSSAFYDPLYIELAETIARAAPAPGAWKVFFANSGTEAVEGAIKLARYATGRAGFIAFRGGFHGRTLGSLSLTASKAYYKRGFGPLVPGVTHVDYPHASTDGATAASLNEIERVLRHVAPPEDIAAIIVEPILGEGGYVVPPDDWLPALRSLCDQHGILLIADEVQSGMGRTGRMFAIEHFGTTPDIVVMAKGIASGLPLGAVMARADLMSWSKGAHGSTFGGNPVSCAAALATMTLLKDELIENARDVGAFLIERLASVAGQLDSVVEVRGKGLMIGIEFMNVATAKSVGMRCFRQGLVVLECGEKSLRLCPPLVVSRAQAELALKILGSAIAEVERVTVASGATT